MNYKEIGYRIQIAREEADLNQKELAEKLGISQSTLSNYEKGKRRLYLADMQKIAEALGKTTDYLLQPVVNVPNNTSQPQDDLNNFVEIMVQISSLSIEDRKSVYDYVKWLKQKREG
jgi:transcriptional regulator with XRE-family HTH domain